MYKAGVSDFLAVTRWKGWRRGLARASCIVAIFLLGALRSATGAEFTFASLALLPVMAMGWMDGKRHGLLLALFAAAMWIAGDMLAALPSMSLWIIWANGLTHLLSYSLMVLLVSRVRWQFTRERLRATRDALTGLQNRRAFLKAGNAEVERAQRYQHPIAVIFLDLDDFKQLNDSKGHDAGDNALRATAKALQGAIRANDQLARLGGDEFAVLVPEISQEAAIKAGEKMAAAVNEALADYPPVKASIGVAWFGNANRRFPGMLKAADKLMYQAKRRAKAKS